MYIHMVHVTNEGTITHSLSHSITHSPLHSLVHIDHLAAVGQRTGVDLPEPPDVRGRLSEVAGLDGRTHSLRTEC